MIAKLKKVCERLLKNKQFFKVQSPASHLFTITSQQNRMCFHAHLLGTNPTGLRVKNYELF